MGSLITRNFRFGSQQPHTIYPTRESRALFSLWGWPPGSAQGPHGPTQVPKLLTEDFPSGFVRSTGYTSGSPISADMTLSGETIAGMTLIPGTYTFTIPNDTIILDIGGSSVPEPGTLVMFGSGIIGLAGILRRKINL